MPAPTNLFQPYQDLHKLRNGAGDQRPTALRVLHDEGFIGDSLAGKVYLVTGCSSGLGIETARALYATGADVYMTVRESKKDQGEKAINDIQVSTKGSGRLDLVFLDLASFDSIRAGAKDFLSRSKTLNVLILNAGIMMCPYSKTAEGFEMQIGTNHFAPKEHLLASATSEFNSRVVIVSSAAHTFNQIRFDDINFEKENYDPVFGYAQSKTANIYMANQIDRLYGHKNLHATSMHPGVIAETQLLHRYPPPDMGFDVSIMFPVLKTVHQGAATQVWAATSKYLNGKGGVYLADCGESAAQKESDPKGVEGYAAWAYDEESEEKLWKISCDAVGVEYK